jgi:phenylacetate-CoA ligase
VSAAAVAYSHLSWPLQEAVLNMYGLRVRQRTHQWSDTLREVQSSETWRVDQQREYVAARLRIVLAEAMANVPRYRRLRPLLDDLRGGWSDVIGVLQAFPPLSRAELAADPESFLSAAFDVKHLASTRTSGTTGTPLTTWVEPSVVTQTDALAWRRTLWAGWRHGDWIARLVGDPVIPLNCATPSRVARMSHVDRRIYLSSFHMSPQYARRATALLLERRPGFLMGYPSALAALCNAAGDVFRGAGWEPKAVLYSSEPLLAHQRAAIAAAVGAPIRGHYGCAERVVSAAECECGAYHLNLLDGYVEGTFADEGLPETTLVTGLLNRAMPLVRYDLGDRIVVRRGHSCGCGRTLPVISDVVTKLEDSVLTPSGRTISPSVLTWAFKDLAGLRQSQIVQTHPAVIEVRVVCDPERLPEIEIALEDRLDRMLFGEMRVNVTSVAQLDLTAAGKTRFVVRECAPQASTPAEPT